MDFTNLVVFFYGIYKRILSDYYCVKPPIPLSLSDSLPPHPPFIIMFVFVFVFLSLSFCTLSYVRPCLSISDFLSKRFRYCYPLSMKSNNIFSTVIFSMTLRSRTCASVDGAKMHQLHIIRLTYILSHA